MAKRRLKQLIDRLVEELNGPNASDRLDNDCTKAVRQILYNTVLVLGNDLDDIVVQASKVPPIHIPMIPDTKPVQAPRRRMSAEGERFRRNTEEGLLKSACPTLSRQAFQSRNVKPNSVTQLVVPRAFEPSFPIAYHGAY